MHHLAAAPTVPEPWLRAHAGPITAIVAVTATAVVVALLHRRRTRHRRGPALDELVYPIAAGCLTGTLTLIAISLTTLGHDTAIADAAEAHWEMDWVERPTPGSRPFTGRAVIDGNEVDCTVDIADDDTLSLRCETAFTPPVRQVPAGDAPAPSNP